jgi:hypothetical protein
VLTGLAYVIVIFGAAAAGARLAIEHHLREPRPGWATITLFVVVAIPSAVGLALRTVGDALERDADRIGDGQLWRLVTALVQQDGGVAGMLFNLVALLALGSVAGRLLGPGRTIVTFFAIGVLAQLPALAWLPVGAGQLRRELRPRRLDRRRRPWRATGATDRGRGASGARDRDCAACSTQYSRRRARHGRPRRPDSRTALDRGSRRVGEECCR